MFFGVEILHIHIWLIAFLVFLILEIFLGDLTMFSLSLGSLFGALCSYLNLELWFQISVSSFFGLIAILFFKKILKKWNLNKKNIQSNVNGMIGKTVKVIEDINNNGTGRISYYGDKFPAISITGEIIKEGENAIIEKVESITVYVKPIKK